MIQEIKSTSKHTALYALGNIGLKVIGVILIPLYTNADYLSHDDFGALALLESFAQLFIGTLSMAMGSSLTRWYWDKNFVKEQKSIFFTSFSFLLLTCIPFGIALSYFANPLSQLIFGSYDFELLLHLTIAASAFQILNNQALALVKLQSRSGFHSLLQILKFTLVLLMILWGLLYQGLGLEAIWRANLIGEIIILIILSPYIIRNIKLKFQLGIFIEMLKFSLPLMLAIASGTILTTADRFMLNSMSNMENTGVYALGYKIANTLKLVISTSLTYALVPIRMKKINEPNHKNFFTKSNTYTAFVFMIGLMAISLFALEGIKLFTASMIYWKANYLIPIISFALFFGLLKDNVLQGLFIVKKTKIIGYLVFITSIINIGINYALIPVWDIYGAAVATLISQFIFFGLTAYYAHKAYTISYEWIKITKLAFLAATMILISVGIQDLDIIYRFIIKIILFISFPFILIPLNFYSKIELDTLKKIISVWRKPKKIIENLKRVISS